MGQKSMRYKVTFKDKVGEDRIVYEGKCEHCANAARKSLVRFLHILNVPLEVRLLSEPEQAVLDV